MDQGNCIFEFITLNIIVKFEFALYWYI